MVVSRYRRKREDPKHLSLLTRLQLLRPLSTLESLRDSTKEFSNRSTFFGPFVRNPQFSDAVRSTLQASLEEINSQVLSSHAVFEILKRNLDAGHAVVQASGIDSSTIEAVPSRISDLLENTEVSIRNAAGVALPLTKHGSGTQSLSVMSLFFEPSLKLG